MKNVCLFFVISLLAALAACSPDLGGGSLATAEVSTVLPEFSTPVSDLTPQPPPPEPTLTPIPPLEGGGLGPTELKYRVLEKVPDLFFCDPDYYPIARAEESDLARQRFPELQANTEEFDTILAHNDLSEVQDFTDEQKLLIYREHKKLAAIQFERTDRGYQFLMTSAKEEGEGEQVSGLVDGQGKVSIEKREQAFATCPICLAFGASIDTPHGRVPVQELRAGMLVWTVDESGARVAQAVVRVSRTIVPASHQVVHLVLMDGRELWVSPGHPLADGRQVGQLHPGNLLDGAEVLSSDREPYDHPATYDLLPAGPTGFYWANGILMGSTLK